MVTKLSFAEARFVEPAISTLPEHTFQSHAQSFGNLDTNLDTNLGANLGIPRSELLIINFWATWCAPCVHELPTLAALSHHIADKPMRVVLVNEDLNFAKAQSFLERFDFSDKTRHFFDQSGKFLQKVQGRGLPITLIVSPERKILRYAQGSEDWNRGEIHALLDDLASESSKMGTYSRLRDWWNTLFD